MTPTDPELADIKRLDLLGYLAHLGFERHARKSSQHCTVLKRGSDHVLVTLAPEGHLIWSTGERHVGGSILDAAMHFVPGCKNLGHARRELRPWLAGGLPFVADAPVSTPEPDRLSVLAQLARCQPIDAGHAFLRSRHLTEWLLRLPSLADRVLQDARGNAVFVYHDSEGPCGLELRNDGFKGFTEGSVRGLWHASDSQRIDTLILAESPIDALSIPTMQGNWEGMRLIAFGGSISERQRGLIQRAAERLPERCLVKLCFDRDQSGDRYCQIIEQVLAESGRDDLAIMRSPPKHKDYNEDLAHRSAGTLGIDPAP